MRIQDDRVELGCDWIGKRANGSGGAAAAAASLADSIALPPDV